MLQWRRAVLLARGDHAADGLAPTAPEAALPLSMLLVFLWLSHLWYKVGFHGMTVTEQLFRKNGLPGWLARIDIAIEAVGVAMLLFGVYVLRTARLRPMVGRPSEGGGALIARAPAKTHG